MWRIVGRWLRWRGILLAIIFVCGLSAFLMGVEVSDRGGLPESDLMTKVYYTLGLFVLGGMDLGVPVGGSSFGQALLWVAYFAAPLVTASAVVEGIIHAVNPDAWLMQRMRGHIVISGVSSLSLLYLRRLRQTHPHTPVILVDKGKNRALYDEARFRYRAKIVRGDITSRATLEAVKAERASRILLLTGDDFANLEAASALIDTWPNQASRIIVHLSDLMLRSILHRSAILSASQVFNSHQVAARHLVTSKLKEHFKYTDKRDQIVLAGFGRFGQTVLDELRKHAASEFERVVIIDLEAERAVRVFDEHVRVGVPYARFVVNGDIRDPGVWRQVFAHLDFERAEPIIILGSDHDHINLQVALWLSQKMRQLLESDPKVGASSLTAEQIPQMKIVVRCFENSTFAGQLAQRGSFEVESVADLVYASFEADWFPNKD